LPAREIFGLGADTEKRASPGENYSSNQQRTNNMNDVTKGHKKKVLQLVLLLSKKAPVLVPYQELMKSMKVSQGTLRTYAHYARALGAKVDRVHGKGLYMAKPVSEKFFKK
jgi:hypothetical protein